MGLEDLERDLERAIGTAWREQPLFELGLVVVSPGAFEAIEEAGIPDLDKPFGHDGFSKVYLERHRRADWPEEALSDHERQMNLSALESGERIVGAFVLPNTGRRILVVTQAEVVADGWRRRPGTAVILPGELGR